jgi:hypothetical protein
MREALVATILLDANVYDKLQSDTEACATLRALVDRGLARLIATPMVLDELQKSPFGGPPNWFPVAVEAESVTVLGYAPLGMRRLDDGGVNAGHRGESNKLLGSEIGTLSNP